jgi:hypothetical protein
VKNKENNIVDTKKILYLFSIYLNNINFGLNYNFNSFEKETNKVVSYVNDPLGYSLGLIGSLFNFKNQDILKLKEEKYYLEETGFNRYLDSNKINIIARSNNLDLIKNSFKFKKFYNKLFIKYIRNGNLNLSITGNKNLFNYLVKFSNKYKIYLIKNIIISRKYNKYLKKSKYSSSLRMDFLDENILRVLNIFLNKKYIIKKKEQTQFKYLFYRFNFLKNYKNKIKFNTELNFNLKKNVINLKEFIINGINLKYNKKYKNKKIIKYLLKNLNLKNKFLYYLYQYCNIKRNFDKFDKEYLCGHNNFDYFNSNESYLDFDEDYLRDYQNFDYYNS